ncbi:hypothetical protein [Campylobacter subantarcticus]|uniref:Uncharacterized protein n=1 Tax=Campylobacter subantarcticus LMG 24374 TaxID=1388751 RepID=A0A0A8H7X7_9BACT|nr:hypothetical protein [Campylobacter subantarcticus]AJC90248.1 hypothetical protein CSUB8521_0362 [Campylobacter subantarcticus LMG 24374]EAJ1261805.1 hypothetical protein [Campylobacter lari]
MSKNDKSLEEADVLKILIYSFSFVALCAILILFLIVPFLRDYKIEHSRLAAQQIQNTKALNELQALEKLIRDFQSTNVQNLAQINAEFSQKELLEFMKNYFDDVKINLIPIKKEQEYLKYQFGANVKIKNPQAFYSFLNDLQKYKNLIEISTPVEFKSEEKHINLKFKIKVFYTQAIQK